MSAAAVTFDRQLAVDDAQPRTGRIRTSWGWLIASAAARMYLSIVLSLVAVATVPVLFGWQATVVQTGSMMPHIRPGDIAVTMPLNADTAVPLGRVVAFHTSAVANADGEAVMRLHRIVAVNTDGSFVTQGDANLDADSDPLVRSQIVGQARLLVPLIGLPSLWLGTGNVLAFIVWVFASIAAMVVVALDLPVAPRRPHTSANEPNSQES